MFHSISPKTKSSKRHVVDRKLYIIAVPTVRKTLEALLRHQFRYLLLLLIGTVLVSFKTARFTILDSNLDFRNISR
jgi:hypothetical protein